MAEATDTISGATDIIRGFIPSAKGFGTGFVSIIAWVILAIVFLVIIGLVSFFVVKRLKFNKKIIVFEKIAGRWEPTKNDRAMEVKLSTGGDTIFYLSKSKKYLPNPSKQMGRRVYWYFIRQDGEWINFELGDLDEASRSVGAKFLDKEMRFARTQIQRGLKERYDAPGFWKQYGLLIMSIAYIAIIGVMAWLLFDKFLDVSQNINAGIAAVPTVLDKLNQVLGAMENVCSGGAGYAVT